MWHCHVVVIAGVVKWSWEVVDDGGGDEVEFVDDGGGQEGRFLFVHDVYVSFQQMLLTLETGSNL